MGLLTVQADELSTSRSEAQTQRSQAAAADPAASAWVSANAGTGKTHVLTMRVLRLLLAGTPPERILALTYTKAAAAEMSKRVFDTAGRVGDGRRRDAEGKLAELLGRRTDCRRDAAARASCSPSPSRRRAASRCRPSTPSASACCSAFRWRPACRRASPSSTTHERSALLEEATDEMLAEAHRRKDRAPSWRGADRRPSPTPPTTASTALLREALRERDWLRRSRRLDDDGDDRLRRVERIYREHLQRSARTSDLRGDRAARGCVVHRRSRSCSGCVDLPAPAARRSQTERSATHCAAALTARSAAASRRSRCAVFLTERRRTAPIA